MDRCFAECALRVPGVDDGFGGLAGTIDAEDERDGEPGESRHDFSIALPEG